MRLSSTKFYSVFIFSLLFNAYQSFGQCLSISTTVQNVSCFGGNDGRINLTITPGGIPNAQPPFAITLNYVDAFGGKTILANYTNVVFTTITFTPGNGSLNVAGADAFGIPANGTDLGYEVTVVSTGGTFVCRTKTISDIQITEPAAALTSTLNSVDPDCNPSVGSGTGNINVTTSGGTAPYTFLWSDGSASEDRTLLDAGSYHLDVTDFNNCTTSLDVVVPVVTQANAGTDQNVCADNTLLAGNSAGVGEIGTWTVISGTGSFSNANSPTSSVGSLSIGPNVFRWTITDAGMICAGTFTDVTITRSNPASVDAGSPIVICAGSTATMAGTFGGAATSATWSKPVSADGSFNNVNLSNAIYTPGPNDITAGSVVLTYTTNDPLGPCPAVSDIVTVTINTIAIVDAGTPQIICVGSTVTLAGTFGGSATGVSWSTALGDGSFSNITDPNAIYTPGANDIATGSVTLTLDTDDPAGPCLPASDNVTITINPLPTVDAGLPQTICSGTPNPLGGSSVGGSATTGAWSIVSQPIGGDGVLSSLLQTATPSTVTFSATVVGSYTLRLTTNDPAGPCTPATDDVVITVDPSAIATAGADNSICSGTPTPLGGSSVSGSATTGAWSIVTQPVGGDGVLSSLLQTATPSTVTFSATVVGSYTLRLTTNDPAGPCPPATDDIVITVSPVAIATAGADNTICSATPTPLAGSSVSGSATTGAWSIVSQPIGGDGVLSSLLQTATPSTVTFSATVVGSYTLRLTTDDPAGSCTSATDDVVITVDPGAIAAAGSDNTICSSTPTPLAGSSVSGSATTGAWSIVSQPVGGDGVLSSLLQTATPSTVTFSATVVGSYTLRLTTNDPAGPCPPATDDVVITVTPVAVATAGTDNTICSATPTPLAGSSVSGSATTGAWSIVSQPIGGDGVLSSLLQTATPSTVTFSATVVGSYTLRLTTNDPAGSCTPATDDVVITVDPGAVAAAGPDNTICSSTPTPLAGSSVSGSAITGAWSIVTQPVGGDGVLSSLLQTATPSTVTFSATVVGSYTLRLTTNDPAGPCPPATDDVVITVTPVAVATAGPDNTMCSSTPTPLAGSSVSGSATTGAWSIVSQPVGGDGVLSSLLQTATPSTVTFSATVVGSYTLRLTTNDPAGSCTSATDDVVITIDPGAIAAAGSDNTICSSTPTPLAGSSVSGSATTGAWSIVSQPVGGDGVLSSLLQTATPSTVTFSATVVGSYTLRLTTDDPAGSCTPATDDVVITVDPGAIATAGTDNTICSATPTPLAGSSVSGSATTGAWSIVSQPVGGDGVLSSLLQTATPSTVTFSATVVGSYTLRLTTDDPAGSCTSATDDVVITVNLVAIATAGTDNTICSATPTPLAGSSVSGSATTGAWSIVSQPVGGDGVLSSLLQTATPSTVTFSATVVGSYTLRLTTDDPAGSCTPATDDVVITVDPGAIATAGADNSICSGTPTPLGGSSVSGSATTGAWSIVSQPVGGDGVLSSLLQTATPSTVTFSATVVGSYTLRLTTDDPAGSCTPATDDVVITVDPGAIATAGADNSICSGTPTPLGGSSVSGSVATGAWSIVSQPVGGDGVLSSLLQTATPSTVTFSATIAGSYTLRLTTDDPAGSCVPATNDVVITVGSGAIAAAGPNNSICTSTPTPLAGSSVSGSATTGAWSIVSQPVGGDGVLSSLLQTATPSTVTFSATVVGSYTLRLTTDDPAGSCTPATDDVVITVDPGAIATAGADNSICSSTPTPLAGSSVSGSATTGAWSIVAQPVGGDGVLSSLLQTATPSTVTFSATVAGSYTLRLTTDDPAGLCGPATDDVVILLEGTPTTAVAGGDQTICGPATLAGNTPVVGTGLWTVIAGGAGGSFTDATNPTTVFSGTGGVTYTIRWTISNGTCTDSFDETDITFDINTPTTSNAGPDQSVCATNATLAGNTAVVGTGGWSVVTGAGGSFADAADPLTVFTGTAGVTYTLRWTISSGACTPSNDDVSIAFDLAPTTSTAGVDQTVCSTTATLAGNTPSSGTGVWSVVTGAGGSFADAADPLTVFTGTAGVTYTLAWTISNSCANSVDQVTIKLDAAPSISNAGADQVLCGVFTTNLNANVPVTGVGIWTIVSGAGGAVIAPSNPASQFVGSTGTSYTLRWIITNGSCVPSADDVIVNFAASPVVTSPITVCVNTAAPTLSATASGATGFNWYLGTGVTRTFLATTATGSFTSGAELNLTAPGSVTYEVTAVYGCGESLGSAIVVNVSNTGACAGGGSNCFAFATSDPVIETRPTCANQNDGQLIFGVKGGTGTYVVTLYDSVSVPIFTQAKIGSSAAPITFSSLSPSLTYFYKIDDGTNTCTLPYSLPVQTTVTASATSFNDALCFGEATGTAIINASGSQTGQYFYSVDNGVNWTLFTPGNVVSDLPPNGTYNILVGESITDACVASVSVTINNANPDLQIGTTITDATCNNNDGSIVITPPTAPFIGGGGPYQYALSDGVLTTAFKASTTFSDLAGGVYSVLVQDGLGCVKTITPVNVTFPGFVNFNVTGGDADCSNNGISGSITVDITDIGGVYKVALSTDQFNEPDAADYIDYSEPSITFPQVVRGTYFVYVQSQTASCPTRSTAINIGGSYAVNFDIVSVCSDNKVSIILSNITGEPNIPFSIQVFDKLDPLTPIEDIPVSAIPVTGGVRLDYDDYVFLQIPNKEYLIQINQVQSTFCAFLSPLENYITTRTLFASVKPRASAEDGESYPDEFTGSLGVIDFDGGLIPYEIKIELVVPAVDGQSFETDFEEVGLNSNLQFEKIYENIPAGQYDIYIQDSLGCELKLVDNVPLDTDLFVPNIITPNADDKNDVFYVRNLPNPTLENSKLTITDRWGVKVFSTNSYQNNWDGEGVEDGVYYYTLQTSTDTRKGWIEIKREVKP